MFSDPEFKNIAAADQGDRQKKIGVPKEKSPQADPVGAQGCQIAFQPGIGMQAAQIMAQERVYAQKDKGLGQHAEKKANQQAGYDDLYAMQNLVQEKMKDDLFLSA